MGSPVEPRPLTREELDDTCSHKVVAEIYEWPVCKPLRREREETEMKVVCVACRLEWWRPLKHDDLESGQEQARRLRGPRVW